MSETEQIAKIEQTEIQDTKEDVVKEEQTLKDVFIVSNENTDKYFGNVENSIPKYCQAVADLQQEYLHACENAVKATISLQRDGLSKSLLERNDRFPPKRALGQGNIWLALTRIILRQGLIDDFGVRPGQRDNRLGQVPDRVLCGIAEVDGSHHGVRGVHQLNEAVDQVINEAERAGLASVTVKGYGLTTQCLHDKVRNDPPIVRMHAWAVCIEDARYTYIQAMLPVIIEEQRFGTAFAFVIA